LPLSLDQPGAYIEETGCSLADYLHLYQTRHRDLLGLRSFRTAEHPESVTMTWSLSFLRRMQRAQEAALLEARIKGR
jgi:hypothetical protein